MGFDATKFLQTYRLPHYPPGSKNVPSGGVGSRCPFCGDRSNHLIFFQGTFGVKCWRCGKKSLNSVISKLLKIGKNEANDIINTFKIGKKHDFSQIPHSEKNKLIFPSGIGELSDAQKAYLLNRKFDPEYLSKTFGILGCNHLDPDFAHRIFIPVKDRNGRIVSYQGRDITGNDKFRYRAADPGKEILPIKTQLYGQELARNKWVVVVEGVTGVWRLGAGSVATFGTQFTSEQALTLVREWDRVFILFDPDLPGKIASEKLYAMIRYYKEEVEILTLEGSEDPGSMPEDEAREFMRSLE